MTLPDRVRHLIRHPLFLERHTGERLPDDIEEENRLAALAASGDESAQLDLVSRYLPLVERLAYSLDRKYPGAGAVSGDDMHGEAVYQLLKEANNYGKNSNRNYRGRASDVVPSEAWKALLPFCVSSSSIPREAAKVAMTCIATAEGDDRFERLANAKAMATDPRLGRHRLTPETFDSVVSALSGGPEPDPEEIPETHSDGGITSIENLIFVSQVLDILTPTQRDVVERHYGLAGHEPQSFRTIATHKKVHVNAVFKSHNQALDRIRKHTGDLHS